MIDLKQGPSCDVCGRTSCLKPGNVLQQWGRIDFMVCDRASCNDTACSEVGAQMRTAKRRAHADTAPQHVPVDQLTTWQRQHLGDWVPLREPVPCVAETGHRTFARIDLAKLTKDPSSRGYDRVVSRLTPWQRKHLGEVMLRDESDYAVRVIPHPECPPNSVYFVDSKSGHVSRMTNVSESGEAALAANGIFRTEHTSGPIDPLDIEYDGRTLRVLLEWDQAERRETTIGGLSRFTPAQRSAISAHWSAELRAKVAATKQTERAQVVCERDEDGL